MKKNIYLFYVANNPLWRYFPNSILALANPLLKAGFNPVLIDTALEGYKKIRLDDPLFVGLSTYTDENIAVALRVARDIRKEYPRLPIAWGGPHVIMMPEQTARHPLVDHACYGEGEISVVELAKSIAEGKDSFHDVPGIIWKDRSGKCIKNPPAPQVNMDELDVYPYHLLNEKTYKLKNGKIYYEASRGCPYGCKFCAYDHTKWRKRSPDKVIDDLAYIEERFSPEEIQIIDSNHFMDPAWAKKIWEGKIARNLKFRWEANIRFDILSKIDDDTLDVLARSNCYQLRLGAESGSQKVLDYLNKGITVEQITRGLERAVSHKIDPIVSFMMGYPAEADKEMNATADLVDLIRERFPSAQVNAIYQFQPFPNTKIFEEISKEYHIPQPESLDGWADYNIAKMRRSVFPWLSASQYRKTNVLNSILSYMWCSFKIRNMPDSQRKTILLFRFDPLWKAFLACDLFIRRTFVYLRWKRKVMFAPIEWYIWNFIREKIVRIY